MIARILLALLLLAGLPAGPAGAQTAEPVGAIRFAPGANSGEVTGAIPRGGRALYGFAARAGQQVELRVTAAEENAAVQVYAPGAVVPPPRDGIPAEVRGRALPGAGPGDDAQGWTGALPQYGRYLVVVGPLRGGTEFRLSLAIH